MRGHMRKLFQSLLACALALWMTTASYAACVRDGAFCSNEYVFSKKLLHHLSCLELWKLRNEIFNEHGYCFQRSI